MIFRRTVFALMFSLVSHSAYSSDPWVGLDSTGLPGSRGTFFADITGDGAADAVAIDDDTVMVRVSNRGAFQIGVIWDRGSYTGRYGTFFSDVTGDGKADAIGVNDDMVNVRVSTGSKFLPPEDWSAGAYFGSRGTFFADVTGDGKADAIAVNDYKVTVRRSDGAKFLSPEDWAPGPYFGSPKSFFVDVTGDGKADAIVINDIGMYLRETPQSPSAQQASLLAGDWVFNQNGYWSMLQIVSDPSDPVKFTGSLKLYPSAPNTDPNPDTPIKGQVLPGGTQVEFWRTLTANTEQHFQGFMMWGADPYNQEMAGTVDGTGGWFACKDNACQTPPPGALDGEIRPTTLDPTAMTPLADATSFLYSGSNAVQTGVALGTVHPEHVAVIRGRVLDKENNPLPGVAITILNNSDLGQTLSRSDGRFDLVVNGGGQLTVSYVKDGYLPAQRQVNAPWQDYVAVEDAILIQQDTKSTVINLEDTTEAFHVAQGSTIKDQAGTRQANLLIPQGTQAQTHNADNTTSAVTSLNLRLTEYTAGANGPASMPAPLPPSSAFTYAIEMKADEAEIKRSGKDVLFDRPVPFYTDNFLKFPVGTAVPVGYYDQDTGVWVPSEDGKVIAILAVNNGTVDVDTDGDGVADDEAKLKELGINADEKARLASLYKAGQSLWRVQVKHLSTYDLNFPFQLPPDFKPPANPQPIVTNIVEDPDCRAGSIIECQNQILRESVPLTGTGLSLNYSSNRVASRTARNTVEITLSGDEVPDSLKHIDLEINIAGQQFTQRFDPPLRNRHKTFTWDGKDGFGRPVTGTALAKIRIGYVYPMVYASATQQAASFALPGSAFAEGFPTRDGFTVWQELTANLGTLGAEAQSVAGWALSIHHRYDPIDKTLHLGTGEHRSANALNARTITTVAGKGSFGGSVSGDGGPATAAGLHLSQGVAVGRDGSLYIAETSQNRIRRVGSNGIITTFAGGNGTGFSGDDGPARKAQLQIPSAVAVGPDDSLYVADTFNRRVRKVGPDGIITTVAGKQGGGGFSGDGGPAKDAVLNRPSGVAIGPDGSVYIADTGHNVIRRVGLDGIITTIAGKRSGGLFSGDGGPAKDATLNLTLHSGIAVALDGTLFIADTGNHRIRKVRPDGIITTVAGSSNQGGFDGDGGPATSAKLSQPLGVTVGPDGSLYIADTGSHHIRRVGADGIITTMVGTGIAVFNGDGGPARTASVFFPTGVAVSPDGSLYIADTSNLRIRRVASSFPGFAADDLPVASADGTELYRFDSRGRHLQTLNTLTGKILYQFTYDVAGRLISIVDADRNTTKIERDPTGTPTAIIAPFGQRTILTLDTNGHLASVTNPAGEAYRMTYTHDGLLTEFKDPKGNVSQMRYDQLGRLESDSDAAGGSLTLTRTETEKSYTVNIKTALGRSTDYLVETLPIGDTRRLTTAPDGTKTETIIGKDGTRKTTLPDGTVVSLVEGPDPRFSMQAPIPKILTMSTGGLTSMFSMERTVSLADPTKPLSLMSQTDTIKLNGRPFKSVYDAATKSTTSTSAVGRLSKVTTDNLGRIMRSEVTGLAATTIGYENKGRLATITQGEGSNTRQAKFDYNDEGYLKTLTDPLGRVVSFGYNAAGRVTKQTLPDERVIVYGYDTNGNLTSLAPPGRPAHVFQYDKVNQTSAYEPPAVAGTGNTLYTYNLDKDLSKITRPDGQTIGFDYDTGGRLQTLTLPSGKLGYGYDATTGKLAEIKAQDATLTYTYKGALLAKSAWTGSVIGQVERAYDNDFRVTSLTVNGANPITYQYDDDSLLTNAGDLTLTRNPQNGLLEGTGLVGVTDNYTYNSYGEVTSYEAKANGSSLLRFESLFDKLGRIKQKKEIRGGTTHIFDYNYDHAGRLAEVKRDGTVTASYGYDANGNRTNLNGATIAHYDDQDRLLDYQDTTYQYSANGELKQKSSGSEVTKYDYDVLGNLKKVTLPNNTVIEYLIDGQNRRLGKKIGGNVIQAFLYQSQLRPIAELSGSGAVVSRFVYATGVNVPDYMIKGGATYRIIKDHLGSPRLVVDVATSTVAQELEYDAFGKVTKDTSPGFLPFGFAGGIYDGDTKLVRFGARDYDAETGRWTAKDPILFSGGQMNLYAYVANDPINWYDTDGNDIWIEGPTNKEPNLHQSINVGDPNGPYSSYSFGLERLKKLRGEVYTDVQLGGEIEAYKKTTPEEDKRFKEKLDKEVGQIRTYGWDDTCRSYSQRKFSEAPGTPMPSPVRILTPGDTPNWTPFVTTSQTSSTTGTSTSR